MRLGVAPGFPPSRITHTGNPSKRRATPPYPSWSRRSPDPSTSRTADNSTDLTRPPAARPPDRRSRNLHHSTVAAASHLPAVGSRCERRRLSTKGEGRRRPRRSASRQRNSAHPIENSTTTGTFTIFGTFVPTRAIRAFLSSFARRHHIRHVHLAFDENTQPRRSPGLPGSADQHRIPSPRGCLPWHCTPMRPEKPPPHRPRR